MTPNVRLTGKVALVAGATAAGPGGAPPSLARRGRRERSTARGARREREVLATAGRRRSRRPPSSSRRRAATGIAVAVDHLEPEHGSTRSSGASTPSRPPRRTRERHLGGEQLAQCEHADLGAADLQAGLRLLRLAIDTHLITSAPFALPLLIRQPGGLRGRDDRRHARVQRRERTASRRSTTSRRRVTRLRVSRACELAAMAAPRSRSRPGSDALGDDARHLRGHRGPPGDEDCREPAFRGDLSSRRAFVGARRSPRFADRPGRAGARRRRSVSSCATSPASTASADIDGSQPDCWRYMVEVQDPGLPRPDATGYRWCVAPDSPRRSAPMRASSSALARPGVQGAGRRRRRSAGSRARGSGRRSARPRGRWTA